MNSSDSSAVLDGFADAWRRGQPPRIVDFFQAGGEASDDASRRSLLEDLVKLDLEFRWRGCGQPERDDLPARPIIEDYLVRFPILAGADGPPAELLAGEYRVRWLWGDRPERGFYHQRFPLTAGLGDALDRVEAELAAEAAAQTEGCRHSAPKTAPRPEDTAVARVSVEHPSEKRAETLPSGASGPREPQPEIPGYEVYAELGRGGAGVVYRAWQRSLEREVALKLLSEAHARPLALARFRSEARAAARLHHPHIVQVYEFGEHAGRPYLTLELVEGGTLSERLRAAPLTPAAAAGLVETMARAVHDAHEQAIIHRDLKPGNILLSAAAGAGPDLKMPKIADFGLAKRLDLDAEYPEAAALTQTGDIVGTPSYMAPEQASGGSREVTFSADIYALGAILYDTLTGRPPFRAATVLETLEQVRIHEPVPPRRLNAAVPRDLETVCLKCLAKDPAKRYANALALAEDLRRFREGRPTMARPAGALERAVRWARRRPALAALAVVSAAAVTILGSGGLWYHVRLERALERAVQAELMAKAKAAAALAEEQKARESAVQTQTVLGFFQNKVLAAARPQREEGGLGPATTIRAAVDAAEPQITVAFAHQPAVEASLRDSLGMTYGYLGELPRAIQQLERARELRRTALGPDDLSTFQTTNNLGEAYGDAGRLADALALFQANLALERVHLGVNHPETLRTMNLVAVAHWAMGRMDLALPLYEETLTRRSAILGPDHADTLTSMNNLALAYRDLGRLDDALPLMEKTVQRLRATLGAEHSNTLGGMNNLALAYEDLGRLTEAIVVFEDVRRISLAKLGPEHPDMVNPLTNLGVAYHYSGNLDRAQQILEEAARRGRVNPGMQHPMTIKAISRLAAVQSACGKLASAEALLREALEATRSAAEGESMTAGLQADLGDCLAQQGKFVPAEGMLRQSLRVKEHEEPDAWRTFDAQSLLGSALLGQKRYAEAEPLLRNGYEGLQARAARIPVPLRSRVSGARARLVQLYDAWHRAEEAARWRKPAGR